MVIKREVLNKNDIEFDFKLSNLVNKKVSWSKLVNFSYRGNKLFLIYIRTGNIRIYELNKEAKNLWKKLDGSYTVSDIVNFSILLKKDVLKFIELLHNNNLIAYKQQENRRVERLREHLNFTSPPKMKLLREEKFRKFSNDYYYFLKKLNIKNQLYVPKVNLDITNKCNLNCKHCYLEKVTIDEPSTSKLKEIIDKLEKAHVQILNFTGGEPFLREDIFELLEYAYYKGLELILNINGTLLDDKKLRRLRSISEDIVLNVSLDGRKEMHDFLRGKGNFVRTINGIRLASSYGFFIRVNYTVHKKNLFDIPKIYFLANKLRINDFHVIPLHKVGAAKDRVDLHLNFYNWILIIMMYKTIKFLRRIFGFWTKFEIVSCATFSHTHIDTGGYLHYCDQISRDMPLGNIFEDDLLEIWHSEKYKSLFKIKDNCRLCKFHGSCRLECKAEIYSSTGNFSLSNIFYPRCKILTKFFNL